MFPGAQTLPEPELFVSLAEAKFDHRLRLTHDETRTEVEQLLEALVEWTARVDALVAA
jgi:hypothetical protein